MKRVFICLISLLLLCNSVICSVAETEQTILTVQGDGVVYMDADQATITIGVREAAPDVMKAQSAVNGKMAAIIQVLTEKGIEKNNLFTNTIGIYPNYDYSGSDEKIAGYTAYNSVSVLTTDIEQVGAYIDSAFAAGANTLDNVQFSASDTQAANDQALTLAVKNAMDKANVLAKAAGMEVKFIKAIHEGTGYNSINTAYRADKFEALQAETLRFLLLNCRFLHPSASRQSLNKQCFPCVLWDNRL